MEGAHNENEHTHDGFVAGEDFGSGEFDFGLNFVGFKEITGDEFEEKIVKREKGEDEEKEEDVVAVEEVIGFVSGVIEPQGFGGGEMAAQGGFRLVDGGERQHFPVRV